MYTMQRTQIYLSEDELARLDREAERTGRTRSRLIRDAINRAYAHQVDMEEFERVLRENAEPGRVRHSPGRNTSRRSEREGSAPSRNCGPSGIGKMPTLIDSDVLIDILHGNEDATEFLLRRSTD